ncbi:MAG: TetR/AcrR family transcriptional regulator [Deltaproteobacteria bacterium]|nr:MAG: TetR/AcrR family transcriptional regulator [Deltaproteobacteria bacterium]
MSALLPEFPCPEGIEPAVLDASRAVVGLYLFEGGADRPIKELAAHTGLSERTFYRYFPRKEDVVRPYLRSAVDTLVKQLRVPSGSLRDQIAGNHGAILDLAQSLHVRRLLDVLGSTERLRAVWLQVLTDAEQAFAVELATRLGISADSTRARFAASALVAAGRLALESEERLPSEVFAECLALLHPHLFHQEA